MSTLEQILIALVYFWDLHLAVSWIPQNLSANIEKRAQDVIDGIGVFGLLGLVATFLIY
jgi:hypothetical protein